MIDKMRSEFINYMELILPPFCFIWLFVVQLPQAAFPLRLAAQIFSFIFVRDSMISTRMWTIQTDFTLAFLDDATSLFLVSISSVVMAGMIYITSKKSASIVLFRTSPAVCFQTGILASFLVYSPVYFLKNHLGTPSTTINDFYLLLGNLSLALCGNLVEEMLFRSCLASYLKNYGITPYRSAFLQAYAFALFHLYLAYIVTNCGALLIVFTFWEGFICAVLQHRYGLLSSTLAHGLAIFYITANVLRF